MTTRSNATTTTSAVVLIVVAATTAAVLVVTYTFWTQSRYQHKDKDTTTTRTTISPQETLDLIRRRRSIFPKHYCSDSDDVVVDRQVLNDMLEAATWAPSHHLTEPWHFIVFSENRHILGQFLAEQYKTNAGDCFVEAKFKKKIRNCEKASFVIGLLCTLSDTNPAVEDVCSVAAAVQNMHLVATAHKVGAYWSTSGIYAAPASKSKSNQNVVSLENSTALRKFLNLGENDVCLGWMFVGPFKGKWPLGRRRPCRVQEW